MEKQRKSGKNEMQLKTGRKAWKISKRRFSQTVRRPISQCENFANPFRNAKISQPKIRNAKISQCEISQCQMPFRNANFEFTLPIPISQCENLAIPNSQCENFAMRNFAMPNAISQCEIHCLCEIHCCEIFRPCHPL